MKLEIKQILEKLTDNIKRCSNIIRPKTPNYKVQQTISMDAELELKFHKTNEEYRNFRRIFNASKQTVMKLVAELRSEKVQSELEKFIEFTDRFEQIEAKQQGINHKLLALTKRSQTPEKQSIKGKKNNLEVGKSKNELELEKEKNPKLEKLIKELKMEKDNEIKAIQENLDEYIKIADKQYSQISILKKGVEILKKLIPAINKFFNTMDELSIAVTENKTKEINQIKYNFNENKETILKIIREITNCK